MTKVDTYTIVCYNVFAGCDPEIISKGGSIVEVILALLISVEAGLLVELICRWLDGNDRKR